jgi:hypothetical protein
MHRTACILQGATGLPLVAVVSAGATKTVLNQDKPPLSKTNFSLATAFGVSYRS